MPGSSKFRQFTDTPRHFRWNRWAAFVQDDWKVRPHLTINWAYVGMYSPIQRRKMTFSATSFSVLVLALPSRLPGPPPDVSANYGTPITRTSLRALGWLGTHGVMANWRSAAASASRTTNHTRTSTLMPRGWTAGCEHGNCEPAGWIRNHNELCHAALSAESRLRRSDATEWRN